MGLIHLYSATSTSFDNNGTPLVTAREAVVKRDEGFQLTFNIPISQNELHKRVQKEMIVSAMTPDGVNYFRIWDIEKRTTDVKVTALQLLYSLDVKQINPFGGKKYTGNTVLQAFANSFKSSITPYTFSSSILTSRDFYTNEEDDTSTSHNALAILNKITDTWSGELMLNGFDVRMISKLGTKTDALLYEHKNIASFSDSSSMNGIVTRIYATATYTPERAEGATEDPEPVVLTATVDSPLINDYAVVYEATAEYNDARTVDELRTEILKQYSEFNVDKPERTIDVDTNIVDGTAINFGDELVLKYLVHDVDEVIRCVGYEYDPISENYIGVTLGTLEKTFLTKVTEGLSSSVANQINKINKQIQVVQSAANGKNRVTYGPNPVPNPIEGDLWFYHPEGRPDEIELLIYQNGLWLPAPFLTDQDKSAFEQEVADYQNAVLAEVALKDKEYKEIFDAYDEKVVTIDQGIADAATKAQSALEEAGISTDLAQTAKDLADTAKTNAQTALSDASQAISDAQTAITQAGQAIASSDIAKTNAQTAIADAKSALTEAGNAKTATNSLSVKVDDLEGEVELKASQTEVDTVKGTVSGHTTTLSQHATAISSKAESSLVNTIKGTVDTHTSEISQNATAITQRLTQAQVNSLVDGKGFSTVNYVDNQITASASGIRADISVVEGKIDGLEIGGRNLITLAGKNNLASYPPYNTDWEINGSTIRTTIVRSTTTGVNLTLSINILSESIASNREYTFSGCLKVNGNIPSDTIFTNRLNTELGSYNYKNTEYNPSTGFFKTTIITTSTWLIHAQTRLLAGDILEIEKPKVEYGNIATDWSPAPEDTVMENDFNVFKASYEATAQGFGVELTKVEGKIDGLEVGGRNLLTGSKDYSGTWVGKAQWAISSDTHKGTLIASRASTWHGLGQVINVFKGEQYTFSAYVKSTHTLVHVYMSNASNPSESAGVTPAGINITLEPNTWTYVVCVVSVYRDGLMVPRFELSAENKTIYVSSMKLEKGNVATDWTPAPEDTVMENDFTVFKNSYQNTVDAINTELSKTAKATDLNGMVTETTLATKQFVTAGSMNTTLTNYAQKNGVPTNTQFNTLKNSYDSMVQTIGTNGSKIAQMVMTDSLFSTKVLEQVDVGGRNLLKNTGATDGTSGWSGATIHTLNGEKVFRVAGTMTEGANIPLEPNQYYTTTMEIRPTVDVPIVSGTPLHTYYRSSSNNHGGVASRTTLGLGSVAKANEWTKITEIVRTNQRVTTYKFHVYYPALINGTTPAYVRNIKLEKGNMATDWSPAPEDKANQSQVTQLAGSWALTLKSGNDIKTQINASTDSIRLASKFIHLSGTSLIDDAVIKSAMIDTLNVSKLTGTAAEFTTLRGKVITAGSITADRLVTGTALVDRVFVDTAAINRLTSKSAFITNIKAISIDVGKITGNTASFISAGFKSLNSQSTINGHAIRIQNTAGEFVEMNNTPELRSDDAGGTAVVLGKGRVHFYDSRGHSKGYVGTDMHTAGSYDFGTFLSKGSGIYKFARMADATQTTYAYYTVKAGLTAPASVITNMVQNGYLPDGNAQQFVAKGNMLSQLNGWPNYPNWPTLKAGQQIRYKQLTSQTTGNAYEDIWKFGPSSNGDWRIYFAKHATFQGGTTGASDRRLKHDIETTQVEALHHIESLAFKEFKWNRDNKYEPLGLIAQDSGIVRVADDDMEGIDIQRAIMLGLKGVQELQEIVKEQATEIKQLKEIINQ